MPRPWEDELLHLLPASIWPGTDLLTIKSWHAILAILAWHALRIRDDIRSFRWRNTLSP